jgi:purine-binding chemotaxis protein CheW
MRKYDATRAIRQVEAVEEKRSLCSVHVGGQIYGVDITEVCEILGPSDLRFVPRAPYFIGGLVHYRGEVLTAVSLRALLGMPPFEGKNCVLVIETNGEAYGLLVDEVKEVVPVIAANFEATPPTADMQHKTLLLGTYKLQRGLMLQLDTARLEPMALTAMIQSTDA